MIRILYLIVGIYMHCLLLGHIHPRILYLWLLAICRSRRLSNTGMYTVLVYRFLVQFLTLVFYSCWIQKFKKLFGKGSSSKYLQVMPTWVWANLGFCFPGLSPVDSLKRLLVAILFRCHLPVKIGIANSKIPDEPYEVRQGAMGFLDSLCFKKQVQKRKLIDF